jgi:ABC-type sugar transport system permease subunit
MVHSAANPTSEQPSLPLFIIASIIWNLVVAVGSMLLSAAIFAVDPGFYNLGRPVQVFLGIVALVPAALATLSSMLLVLRRPLGRYLALVINYVGMVLAAVYLLHLWGAFLGIDAFAAATLRHANWLLGFPIAYGLYWLAGRLPEDSTMQIRMEQIGVGLGIITLILFLWNAGILEAANTILNSYGDAQAWLVTGAVVCFAVLGWRLLTRGDYFGETTGQKEAWQGWLMLSPNAIGFMLFFAGPLLLSFWLSFTNDTVGNVPEFIGLRNYGEMLSLQFRTQDDLTMRSQDALDRGYTVLGEIELGGSRLVVGARDQLFWISMRNTILFCLLLVPLSMIPALTLALILNSRLPGMKFFRAVYFLPSVAAVVGTALIWRWLYDPVIGYINYAISGIVTFLNSTLGTSLVDPRVEWLTNQGTVLFAIVFLAAWQVTGFNMVLFLAGLQGIPRILYEAAYVDGANRWQQFRNVTLPMLAPTTFFVIITTVITGLQVFNEPYALISARPMPINATTAVYYLYNRGFFRFEFGYASAVAWVLFGLIFLVTLAQFRVNRARAYKD